MRKNYTTLLLLFLLSLSLNAQIASYKFENNLNDDIGGYTAIYEKLATEVPNPNFLDGETGKKIGLDVLHGIKLPIALNSKIDVSKSVEFSFDFVYEEFNGESVMTLFTNHGDLNAPGISLFAIKLNPDRDVYQIYFSYSDGKYGQEIPQHDGHVKYVVGEFKEKEKVSIKLILDFETNQFSTVLNGSYSSAFFQDNIYDMEVIKNSLKEQYFYFGWVLGIETFIEQELQDEPDIWGKLISVDNVVISSPRTSGNTSVLQTALNNLTNHVNESIVLSESELLKNYSDIISNLGTNFNDAKNEIFTFISTYQNKNEPIFKDLVIVNKYNHINVLEKTLLFLQQYILDVASNNPDSLNNIKFEFAEVFPGKIEDATPRLNNQTIEINATYKTLPHIRVGLDQSDAKRPTGFYIAPGDVAEVTIPSSAVNAGLKALVGAHDIDFTVLEAINRPERISKLYHLTSETTKIYNPYGGGLYIKVPEGTDLGWINITLNNVVKAPYFSTRSGRETNISEWQTQLSNNYAPWVDIESDKFMMTLPTQKIIDLGINDPTELLEHWDNIMDAYKFLGGWPNDRARAEYFLLDTRIGNSYGTGYPQMLGIKDDFDKHPDVVLNDEFYKGGFFITLHEYGHLAHYPTPGYEVEANVNLPAAYIYNKYYGLDLDEALKHSLHERFTINQAMMDWLVTENFLNNNKMSEAPNTPNGGERLYQTRGHAKYVVMAKLFGWESVHNMNKVFYEKNINDGTSISFWDRTTDEDIISAVSKGNNLNMMPLFHFWGLIPPAELKNELSTLPESQIILDYLNEMKTIIPKTKEEFQPYYDHIYPQKFHTLQPRLTYVLENYDTENFYDKMVNQIDYIINEYFSNLSSDSVLKESISVYPNPTKNSLNINLTSLNEENIKVLITDSLGRTILNTKKSGGKIATIDTNSFSKGVYLINLFVQNSKITYKMIKE